MSRQIFLVFFLLLFVCCQLCGQGCALSAEPLQDNNNGNVIDQFFKTGDEEIKKAFQPSVEGQDLNNQISLNHIESAFLVAADGLMVALAELNFSDQSKKEDKKELIVAKYFETNETKWGEEAVKKQSESKWKVQLDTQKTKKKEGSTPIKSFAVVTKGSTIYHITISNSTFKDSGSPLPPLPEPPTSVSEKWHVRVVKGEVTNGVGGTGKKIEWKNPTISVLQDANQIGQNLNEKPTNIPPSDGFAFVTSKDKNIIFIMKGKAKSSGTAGEKNIIAVLQLKEKSDNNFDLSLVDGIEGCYPSFFRWNEKIIMMPTSCSDANSHNVKEFNEDTNKFNDSDEPIACLQNFLKDKHNFTTADIGPKKVLLFTQQKNPTEQGNVFLWMSDGTHVGFVGTVLPNIAETFYGSFLYTKEELFVLHQKYGTQGKKEVNTFSLTRLKQQLVNITETLQAWDNNEKIVSALCNDTRNSSISCTISPPTAGLVGFLHTTENKETKEWKDEYYYSNATVEEGKGTKVTNGFKFNGEKAGAKWLIKNKNGDQPYNFADPGFTLLATVTVGSATSSKDNSILGISSEEKSRKRKSIGLWCSKKKQWAVKVGEKTDLKESTKECIQDKTYSVTLFFKKDDSLKIYIDGEQLTNLGNEHTKIEPPESTEYFYFGADPEGTQTPAPESHVTVTNVLLYNRPFNDSEIQKLKEYVKTIEDSTTRDETTTPHEDERVPTPLPQSTNENEKSDDKQEKAPSTSGTEDGGVGGGVRVFSLLLAVLCVSAPLLHL